MFMLQSPSFCDSYACFPNTSSAISQLGRHCQEYEVKSATSPARRVQPLNLRKYESLATFNAQGRFCNVECGRVAQVSRGCQRAALCSLLATIVAIARHQALQGSALSFTMMTGYDFHKRTYRGEAGIGVLRGSESATLQKEIERL